MKSANILPEYIFVGKQKTHEKSSKKLIKSIQRAALIHVLKYIEYTKY